jgi:hypothetical protein
MPRAEKMQAVDTTWLRMDQPTNRMVIVGVLLLQGPVDLTRLERHLADRKAGQQRPHQRREDGGGEQHAQPFIRFTSSTSIEPRLRK